MWYRNEHIEFAKVAHSEVCQEKVPQLLQPFSLGLAVLEPRSDSRVKRTGPLVGNFETNPQEIAIAKSVSFL